jgi:hypothetical protein
MDPQCHGSDTAQARMESNTFEEPDLAEKWTLGIEVRDFC